MAIDNYNKFNIMKSQQCVNHQLNLSKTKQTHLFSKASRFPRYRKLYTEAVYEIPTTKAKRTTMFGYGNKQFGLKKSQSPPPCTYNISSDFENNDLKNTTSLHKGREEVKFGSFIGETLKRFKNNPSPDKYQIPIEHNKKFGIIGKVKTEGSEKKQMNLPGPGTYKLDSIEIKNAGSYVLSTYKNNISPRYHSSNNIKVKKSQNVSSYDLAAKQIGKYPVSKYKNISGSIFSKSLRVGLEEKSKVDIPGFKYRRFSQFG